MLMNKKIAAAVCGLGMVLSSTTALAEVAVVVSAKSAAGNLTTEQVADIFLGKFKTLPGGAAAVPVDQAEGSSAREEFYSKATGKNPAQLKAYWSKQIFTGKGQPPKEVGDSAAVKNLISNNPNMIGYVDSGAVDGSVKVLATIR